MIRHFLLVLCVLLVASGSLGEFSTSESSEDPAPSPRRDDFMYSSRPTRRSLLSLPNKNDTALVAALNGTIHLVESNSMKVLWSFTSGPSIYSSYQAPLDQDNATDWGSGFFVDCGEDWELYMHGRHFGKVKLPMTAEEFISSTPHVSEDGGVILGSKQTTVFLLNAKTGKLIHSYRSLESPPTPLSNKEESVVHDKDIEEWVDSGSTNLNIVEPRLYITRTDYSLQSFAQGSDKVLWNMTVAEIGAAFLCQGTENLFSRPPLNLGCELGPEYNCDFEMPLPCQSKAVVYRYRGHTMLEPFPRHDRLQEAHQEDRLLLQPNIDKTLDFHPQDMMLPAVVPNHMLPSEPKDEISLNFQDNNDSEAVLPLSPPKIKNSGISDQNVQMPYNDGLSMFSGGSILFSLIVFIVILLVSVIYCCTPVAGEQGEMNKQPNDSDSNSVPSKKRKIRKSAKNNISSGKKDEHVLSANKDGSAHIASDNSPWLNLNGLVDGDTNGRTVGKLFVSNIVIAKGSNGTIVLEGIHEGRSVAVKRLVRAHHDVAFKEIQNLIASDRHPNIVRWYGVEYDQDFVYLSLERCTCSLNDLLQIHSNSSQNPGFSMDQATKAMMEYRIQLDSVKCIVQDIKLWKSNGYPSSVLLSLMRDVVSGLVHLHDLGIIHRDLKPQNVLIIKEKSLCAKLSDMGISKRLVGDMSSLGHHATGYGSSGWQAPEQLLHGRQTRAVDLFSLGCILFSCITGGRHPFGDPLERDVNIVKNKPDLFLVEFVPEALDLFARLLDPKPELRPKASEVLYHPLFWSSELRLSFLRDASDRVELEDRESNSHVLKALEGTAPTALGGKWNEKMEPAFLADIGRYRRYKFDSVRDLLRVIRNKLNHYRELPREIQEILGSVPEGFDSYFSSRFPRLLIEVYKVVSRHCKGEECFQKYFKAM